MSDIENQMLNYKESDYPEIFGDFTAPDQHDFNTAAENDDIMVRAAEELDAEEYQAALDAFRQKDATAFFEAIAPSLERVWNAAAEREANQ